MKFGQVLEYNRDIFLQKNPENEAERLVSDSLASMYFNSP